MQNPFYLQFVLLLLGIFLIVLLTARFKIHPFFALIIVSFLMGIGAKLGATESLSVMKEGFGHILRSLGFIIILGTTLGIILERTGSTRVMAEFILKIVGAKNSALAMSITGFIVGLPIFCDSGFIVLSGLNLSLAKRSGLKVMTLAVSLATGLYSVHCLIPPHPGAAAAAGTIGVDFGKLIGYGILVAIPATIAGYLWAVYAGSKIRDSPETEKEEILIRENQPRILMTFLPVFAPILLIALKSFLIFESPEKNFISSVFSFTGDPSIALSIGILLALLNLKNTPGAKLGNILKESVEKAGGILIIIGAGGAFGAVLAASKIGQNFSEVLPIASLGIFFPFLLTFLLKTAQGSSTVAIITAASIVLPLLPALGLDSPNGKILCVLSMGAGSMMISHANDAYFWVIANFEKLSLQSMLKVYSAATILMGVVTITMVYLLSLVL